MSKPQLMDMAYSILRHEVAIAKTTGLDDVRIPQAAAELLLELCQFVEEITKMKYEAESYEYRRRDGVEDEYIRKPMNIHFRYTISDADIRKKAREFFPPF